MTASPIARTVKESLVQYLRNDIILGKFLPGEYLRLDEIAATYDVSTMPVREALRDLEDEGLVVIYPHRGAKVSELSVAELEDIYDMRAVLEAMAARLAVPRMTQATYAELDAIVEQMDSHLVDVVAEVDLNHQFHCTLYSASGREHLCELNRELRFRTQHYLRSYMKDLGRMPVAQQEHRAIVEACRQGQAELVATLIHSHVLDVGKSLVEYVRQREASDRAAEGVQPAKITTARRRGNAIVNRQPEVLRSEPSVGRQGASVAVFP
jgi:DNA-binding GntR family transcriptional regulator